jgi:hypothetical protein
MRSSLPCSIAAGSRSVPTFHEDLLWLPADLFSRQMALVRVTIDSQIERHPERAGERKEEHRQGDRRSNRDEFLLPQREIDLEQDRDHHAKTDEFSHDQVDRVPPRK